SNSTSSSPQQATRPEAWRQPVEGRPDHPANSQPVVDSAFKVTSSYDNLLRQGNSYDLQEQRSRFAKLVDDVALREHDGVGMPPQHIVETFNAVDRLLNTDSTVADLTSEQKMGLARQILTAAGKPGRIDVATDHATGPSGAGAQLMAFDRVPGKI